MEEEMNDNRLLSEAAAMMGRVKTQRKVVAAQENGRLGGRPKGAGRSFTEEAKAKMRAAQQARRKREKANSQITEQTEVGAN